MTPDETITLLANANWKDAYVPDAAAWLKAYLHANLKGHQTWRTKDIFDKLGVPPERTRTVTNALYKIRKSGLVEGYYRSDSTKRHMGHGVIIWGVPVGQSVASPAASKSGNVPVVTEEDF